VPPATQVAFRGEQLGNQFEGRGEEHIQLVSLDPLARRKPSGRQTHCLLKSIKLRPALMAAPASL